MCEKIYALQLNDSIYVGDWQVTRVPGGWIYAAFQTAVFVPFSREFQTTPPSEHKGDLAKGYDAVTCKRCHKSVPHVFQRNEICGNCFDELRDNEKADRAEQDHKIMTLEQDYDNRVNADMPWPPDRELPEGDF